MPVGMSGWVISVSVLSEILLSSTAFASLPASLMIVSLTGDIGTGSPLLPQEVKEVRNKKQDVNSKT
jgi:hypothetical protein